MIPVKYMILKHRTSSKWMWLRSCLIFRLETNHKNLKNIGLLIIRKIFDPSDLDLMRKKWKWIILFFICLNYCFKLTQPAIYVNKTLTHYTRNRFYFSQLMRYEKKKKGKNQLLFNADASWIFRLQMQIVHRLL